MTRFVLSSCCAAGLAAFGVAVSAQSQGAPAQQPPAAPQAQQPPARPQGMTFDPPGTLPKQRTVHITGENPGLHLRETANGPVVSDLNFWRVTWSPVGTGHVCYLTTGDGTKPGDLRLALTDNEKLEKYISQDTMTKLLPNFATPPFKVVKAKISFEGDTISERRELCTSDEYKLVGVWKTISPGRFSGMDPGNGFFMTFIIPMAAEGELWLNGKRLPGRALPGPGLPPAYLAFAETWLK